MTQAFFLREFGDLNGRRILRRCFSAVLLLFMPLTDCWAWGIVGHRIVCEIAYDMLQPGTRSDVDKLTAAFKKPNGKRFAHFTESCHFADTARHNAREGYRRWLNYARYDRWHYVNLPRDTGDIAHESLACAANCVLHAIDFHADVVRDVAKPIAVRGEALILLAHWIADIHQPMHVSFADDKGGSTIKLDESQGFGPHLHSAWDAGIIKAHRGKTRLGKYIESQLKQAYKERRQWQSSLQPVGWAQESFHVVTSEMAGYCQWRISENNAEEKSRRCEPVMRGPAINSVYIKRIAPLLEQRLRQAAVRLAATLEQLLAQAAD